MIASDSSLVNCVLLLCTFDAACPWNSRYLKGCVESAREMRVLIASNTITITATIFATILDFDLHAMYQDRTSWLYSELAFQ
jgi:hypothetical protein